MSGEKWFIQKLLEIDQRVTALSRGGVGIGKSSIASGESLTVATDTGEVVFKDGGLDYVSGEVPPVPSSATLAQDFGQLRVTWDGTFAADDVEAEEPVLVDAPLDLDVIEVHASTDPEEANWGEDTMRSQIKTREGGTVPISGFDIDDEVFVVLIALSKTGLRSDPSTPTSIVIEGLNFDQLFNELDAATTIINNAREILIENEKTLGEKLDEVPDAEGIADDIAQARQEAIDAALAELDALEGTLTTKIDGKTTTKWSTSDPPESYSGAVGDTWIKLTSLGTGGREIARSKWNGTTWTVHKVDGASLSNVDASTITAGFLDVANRIRSGSIFADKLLIGSDRNIIPNLDGSRGDTSGWSDVSKVTFTTDTPVGNGFVVAPGSKTTFESQIAPIDSEAEYVMETWAKSTKPERLTLGARWFKDGVYHGVTWTRADVTVADTWQKFITNVTPPQGVGVNGVTVRVYASDNRSTDVTTTFSAKFRPMVGGTLITPGGVQTPHLAADVLEVGNLKAGTAAIAEAVVKKLFAEVVVAEMVTATEFIGENAILTGAVTAPKLTVTEEMWAKFGEFVKIRAGQIEADAIDGMTVTGTTLQSRDGNFRAGDDGVYIAQPDGTSLVRFPTDGSPLSLTAADVEIDRANVGDLEMLNGSVRSGGRFTLESGVVAPVSPPVITSEWSLLADISDNDWTGPQNVTRAGLDQWNGKWIRALNIHGNTSDDKIQIINADGTLDREFKIDFNPRYGITVIWDVVYVFGVSWSGEQPMIRGYDLNTGKRVKSWNYDRAIENQNALGNDGTYLVVAGVYGDGLWVHKRSAVNGSQVGGDMRSEVGEWPKYGNKDLYGVHIDGSELTVVPSGGRIYKISGSTLKRKTDSANRDGLAGWGSPGATVAAWWDSNHIPHVATVDGQILKASDRRSQYEVEACVTWYDGTHETDPSPTALVRVGARAFPVISLPSRPGVRKRVYYRPAGSSTWARKELASEEKSFRIVLTGWGGGTYNYPPPTENTFPVQDPAELRTSNLNFQVLGDGSGKWGKLRVSAGGDVTGVVRTATGLGVDFPTVAENGGSRTVVVTFPSGRFTKAPSVSAMTSHGRVTPVVFNITKDSFSFRVWNFTSSEARSVVGSWLAVEEA